MLLIASEFLTKQIQEGTKPNTNIDVYNVRKNVDELATSKKALHPAEYKEKKVLKAFHNLTKVLFIIAITIFVVVPFVKQELDVIGISQLITLFAFASLCINVALTDQQADIQWKRQNFEIDKQIIIDNAFPGYLTEFYTRMQHVEAYREAQKQKAENQNEDNNGDRSDKENTKTVNNPILQQIEQGKGKQQ